MTRDLPPIPPEHWMVRCNRTECENREGCASAKPHPFNPNRCGPHNRCLDYKPHVPGGVRAWCERGEESGQITGKRP